MNIIPSLKYFKIIIFGGKRGSEFIINELKNLGFPFEIVAFANNDINLQNTLWFNKPVINPKDISMFDYDQIILSTEKMDIKNEIIEQLTKEYDISPELINTDFTFSKISVQARINALKNVSEIIYENNISGAVAELGVFQGEFARHINVFFPDRKLYLFDTFEGFNNHDVNKDLEIGVSQSILNKEYDFSNTGQEFVINRMKYKENCIIKKGYFPETAKNLNEKFVFVSLDADLYQPMLEGLKYFYPRLEKGGYIFIHDYISDVFSGTKKAVLEYKNEVDIHYVPMGDNCSIVINK
jgi:O-methyltransferase